MPPAPPFLSPARSHTLVLALGATLFRWIGYFGAHLRTLIWEPSFPKMLSSIFFLENASQIGFSIPDVTAPLSYQRQRSPKRANESERAINPGVQGRSPGPLSPHFSGEMGTPAGQAGQRGAAPRGTVRALTTRRVRTTAPPAPRFGHISRANSAAPRAPHSWASGWMNRGCPSFSWMASATPWFRATPPVIMQGPVPPARR